MNSRACLTDSGSPDIEIRRTNSLIANEFAWSMVKRAEAAKSITTLSKEVEGNRRIALLVRTKRNGKRKKKRANRYNRLMQVSINRGGIRPANVSIFTLVTLESADLLFLSLSFSSFVLSLPLPLADNSIMYGLMYN